ncbi:MAG: hypothetical protein JSR98_22485 [Proteobacteria bacterium]|nr:hypothetical protein [Pseudomonadota bacterium]
MHPDLWADRPEGPQMFADWPGVGSTGPFDEGTTFDVAYRVAAGGKVPDYVYGSDWKRAVATPSDTAAVTEVSYREPRDQDVVVTPHADDPKLSRDTDDTTVAVADPANPSREPAYEAPADSADQPADV